jgi:hypothetical protein
MANGQIFTDNNSTFESLTSSSMFNSFNNKNNNVTQHNNNSNLCNNINKNEDQNSTTTFAMIDNHALYNSKSVPYINSSANSNIDIIITSKGVISNNFNKSKSSLPNSIMSQNLVGTSKNTTPPSSIDHKSPFYDYRLVLELQQNNKKQKTLSIDTQTKKSNYFNNTSTSIKQPKVTDMYIQSIYADIYKKTTDDAEIKCTLCNDPVFDNNYYFNTMLEFKEIICESCMNKSHNRSDMLHHNYNTNNNDNDDNNDDNNDNDDDCISSTLDMHTSLNGTNNTIRLNLDTTILSDENRTIQDDQMKIMNFFKNSRYNISNDHKIHKCSSNNFDQVIKNLKNIERHDLKIRQSIADFRGVNKKIESNNTFWSSFKRKFIKLE